MKKHFSIFIFLVIFISTLIFLVGTTNAQEYKDIAENVLKIAAGEEGAGFGAPADLRSIVMAVIKLMLGFVGTLFVVYAVYAGYLIMTSGGEEEKQKKGLHMIRNAVIGTAIVLASYGITILVSQIFSVPEECTGAFCGEIDVRVEPEAPRFNPDPLEKKVPNIGR